MKKLIIFFLLFHTFQNSMQAQDRSQYNKLIAEAWKLYESKDYEESGQKYSEAFVAFGNKGMTTDRYNAACSYALAGVADSSFVQLFRIAKKGNYTNYSHLSQDSDLSSLYVDSRWEEVKAIVKANKEKAEANLDQSLLPILDEIYEEDQKYRKQIGDIEKKFGRDSDEMKAHWDLIMKKDSINLIKVRQILDERGWLGPDVVGNRGNSTLFLVIQHADIETQQLYLPMMREAVKNNNARPSSLALLEDRVALRTGEKQIYGSQIGRDSESGEYFVSPLIDPANVDQRRMEMGLGPISEYVSRWDIEWNVEKHIERTLKSEKQGQN